MFFASAYESIKLLKMGTLKVFPGAPHALPKVLVDAVNEEFLKFTGS
jgi:hypothetical protein